VEVGDGAGEQEAVKGVEELVDERRVGVGGEVGAIKGRESRD
jgi:hypothetical protein